jgi:hypothetical protein
MTRQNFANPMKDARPSVLCAHWLSVFCMLQCFCMLFLLLMSTTLIERQNPAFADFMEDAATVSAEARELAAVCSTAKLDSATQLRTRVLDLPLHHRHAVFAHLLTLGPLNTLLTTCPFDFLQPIAAALLRDSSAEASAEPRASGR